MNLKRNISLTIITILAFVTANAKIAVWDIMPKYEKLNRYYGNIYVFQQNGKWGLVQSGNKEIISALCDFITPFTNGYALAGIKAGNKYLLEYIVAEDGSVLTLTDKYYLPASNQYVSEGKLAVVDKSGKYGYISPDGRTIIKCQFDNALPFKEGWAPVKQGNYTKYIAENFDKNPSKSILPVDFHYGEMTLSSCFSNGKAVVSYNKDFALIGKNGQKIKKLNETEFNQLYKKNNASSDIPNDSFKEESLYSIITQNGKCGLKEGETVVLIPQFDSFPKLFSDGTVLTMVNGKYGLLKIMDGDIIATTSCNELNVDWKGNISSVSINYTIPSSLSSPKLLIDLGDGQYKDFSSQQSRNGVNGTLSIIPIAPKNAESCIIRGVVENEGVILADFEKSFVLNYPIKLRVSPPGPSEIRANEGDMATFGSTIFNDSNKQITITATWSTGKEPMTIVIPAHGSKTIYGSVYVPSDFERDISVVLSSGDRAHATIKFKTFF